MAWKGLMDIYIYVDILLYYIIYSEIHDARARAGPKSNINPASISKLLVNLSCLRLVLEMVSNILANLS